MLQTDYDYPATTQVPGTTNAQALADYVQSGPGQAALASAITSNGGTYAGSLSLQSVSTSSSVPTSVTCSDKFGHWCLDHSHITRYERTV